MKNSTMKYTRWQLQWQGRLIGVAAAMMFFVLSAQAQTDAVLPPVGGSGGGHLAARWPQGQIFTGVGTLTGDDVDAIRLICVTAYGPADAGPNVVGGESFGGDG